MASPTHPIRVSLAGMSVWFLLLLLCGVAVAAGPVEPAKGPETLKTPADLTATLFASEPMLSSPSDIDVDARGRVWVCEVMNYRGKQQTRKEGDRILVLEDTNGDGRADQQTVFYQGLDVNSALGICVIGEGAGRKVIVSCAPNIFIFHDDNGDLVADRKESLFTKTGQPQHDHSVHAFSVGPDGRWYFNFGNTGNSVHDKDGKPVVDLAGNTVNDSGKPYRQGMAFRCRPDGSDFEVLGHNFRNNYEIAVDSFGSLWQSDNDDDGNRGVRINWVMEYGNYGYVDERNGQGWQVPRTNLEAEIPRRHWHQNDPGVVPNLLLTGAGSPAGICVYEGSLLPERFRGALVHCEPGMNVVRGYPVTVSGAGYAATIESIADGAADQWFRPSDVCVAPDGSLMVADWYDPGVGGHGMADTQKGRIYRIAPKASAYKIPAADFDSVAGAVAALGSPNLCTRATALESIRKQPEQAAPLLAAAFEKATDDRMQARLAWAAGMLPMQAERWVAKLAGSPKDSLRVVALRLCRAVRGDVILIAEKMAADPSPAVRREVALALRGLAGQRADRVWAALAARHAAGDRYELEALGIGADGFRGGLQRGPDGGNQWDARLAAWQAHIGSEWKSPAGREIVWRSRAASSAALIGELLADPALTTSESLALLRALDFQDPASVPDVMRLLLRHLSWPEEKLHVILPQLVMGLDRRDAADPVLAKRIDEALTLCAATHHSAEYIEIVRRFGLKDHLDELLQLVGAQDTSQGANGGTSDAVASAAIGLTIELGGHELIGRRLAAADPDSEKILIACGIRGQGKAMEYVEALLGDSSAPDSMRLAAVRAMARTQGGAKKLVEVAKAGALTGGLPQAAAVAISASPWGDVRQLAADVLPMPKAKGGAQLPPVADLLKRNGQAERGKGVFAGVGTCAKCHVVGSEGKAVGPNLSGIGAKLSREALYESMLAPSAAISHNFETWTAVLADGRSITGLSVSQSTEQVVIRAADGIDVTIPRVDVEELVKQPISLMPADLVAALSAEELVDLVAWLETLRETR